MSALASQYPLIVDWKQHELRRAYYASVTFMDSQLGAILDTIEELNLRGRINMAFVGDHGYGLGEHGEWCKQSNFETTTRVPLFFVGPGITPGSVDSASLVEMLDIAPTLTDLAGITVPFQTPGTRWQGASLADLLLAPPPTVAPAGFDAAFSQFPRVYKPSEADAATAELVATAYAAGVGALPAARFEGDAGADADWETVVEMLRVGAAGNTMGLSMRTPTWRYTEWRPFNFSSAQVDWTQTHGTELYNHSSDTGSGPGVFDDFENVNLAPNPEHASTVQQLSQQLRAAWDNPTFKAEQARASRRAT
jgi:iduronate 2-sulfatase